MHWTKALFLSLLLVFCFISLLRLKEGGTVKDAIGLRQSVFCLEITNLKTALADCLERLELWRAWGKAVTYFEGGENEQMNLIIAGEISIYKADDVE